MPAASRRPLQRASRALESAFMTASLRLRGTSRRNFRRSGGVACCCMSSTAAALAAEKGGRRRALRTARRQANRRRSCVDVRRAARLLGTHVLFGADDEPAARDPVLARARDRARDPKSTRMAPPLPLRARYCRVDVAMRESVVVGVAERVEDLSGDSHRAVDRQRALAPHHLPQRLARHERITNQSR